MVKKQNSKLPFLKYVFSYDMNYAEVRLMQFKSTIKCIWKVWVDEPLFFQMLQICYIVN